MLKPLRIASPGLIERLRSRIGRRAAGMALALGLEALLALLLLTLAPSLTHHDQVPMTVFSYAPDPSKQETEEQPAPQSAAQTPTTALPVPPPEARAATAPTRTPPATPTPVPSPLPWIELSRDQMASSDLATKAGPPAPVRAVMGPVDSGSSADTPRVEGSGPHGEPLYAASWYREPYDDELRGYLSTARGPGWGLIICKTVPDYRVEDCEVQGESPEGSGIARAVLAAAWQFRVRPPRIGGRYKVGEWVRIRIDYDLRKR